MTSNSSVESIISKNNVKIFPGALVSKETELLGDITVGSMTIVHPSVRIIAEAGPIVIGENNIIEEKVCIINRLPPDSATPADPPTLTIGASNVFEVDCCIEARKIGDNNVVESKAFVGRDVELTSGCVIAATCRVESAEVIPENTVIFGEKCSRRKQADRPPSQAQQLDFLTKVFPNYHHLLRPMKKVN
ncbi:dynactin subunit 6 isoform X2 [Bacillus rossius redtenbacheri]|uniref:dynactin subunit 6 isoform X2 n=1 Tax=Bacillus rossius redtenbacheri TaxID=93214 RepID=UPI002FDE55C1